MPLYPFLCPEGHTFDQYHIMSESGKRRKCPTCNRWAKQTVSAPNVTGFTDYTRNRLALPFGKKAASKFRNAGDVDKELDRIYSGQKCLGRPSRVEYE